eukprot:1854048-Rhodomonas_salina.2
MRGRGGMREQQCAQGRWGERERGGGLVSGQQERENADRQTAAGRTERAGKLDARRELRKRGGGRERGREEGRRRAGEQARTSRGAVLARADSTEPSRSFPPSSVCFLLSPSSLLFLLLLPSSPVPPPLPHRPSSLLPPSSSFVPRSSLRTTWPSTRCARKSRRSPPPTCTSRKSESAKA